MRGFVIVFLCLALLAVPAEAAPAGLYLLVRGDWNDYALGAAIRDDFARAGIPVLGAAASDALIASVPDGLRHDTGKAQSSFNVLFYWHGAKLGESEESCGEAKLKDCADQFLLDTQSAMQLAR